MLEMNTQNVNVNVSNITGNSKIEDKIVATFYASYSSGMMSNYSTSKSITDMAVYDANQESVDADYAAFEAAARQMVTAITAAVEEAISGDVE